MKRQFFIAVVFLLAFASCRLLASEITNFTKSVNYTPPKSFHMHDFSKDEYSDLFTYWGSGIGYEETNGYIGDEGILFMLGPSCIIKNPQDTEIHGPLLPRSPTDLCDDFNFYYHNPLNLPPARIGKTAGYVSVSASTYFTNNNNYFSSCWIQIKSNIVVRIEIQSTSKASFDAATNSLKTLKISKKEILNIVKSPTR